MTKFMLLTLSIFLSSCDGTDPKSESKNFESVIASLRSTNNIPGLGVGIQKDEELEVTIVGTKIAGKNLPISVFHLGSCTKAMTATLAGILIEEGFLSWNSNLKDLLPDLSLHTGFEDATFEMLLSHRSGLITDGAETFLNDWLFKALQSPIFTPSQARHYYAKTILNLPPRSVPGEKFYYSNGGYMIAAHIMETLTGKSWEDLMQEKIFAPLGMISCGPGPSWGHYLHNQEIYPIFADNPLPLSPAAGVYCSLTDWSKFLNEHLKGLKGEDGIVSFQTFKKLHTVAANDGHNYTFGGWIKLQKDWAGGIVLTHNGSNTWNYAQVWIAPMRNAFLMSTTNIAGDEAVKASDQAISELIKKL